MKLTAPQEWQAQGKYFQYKGHSIFYKDEGQGPILLCIHGFPTASWDWQYMWDHLTQHYRVIAPDMIGFGFSDKPKSYTYSIHDQADLHEVLLDKLGISNFHVLAHDYGDTVAQELLARDNEQKEKSGENHGIQSLVLLNGGIFPEMHRARTVQKVLAGPFGFILSQLFTEKRFQKGFSEVFGPESKPSPEELKIFWSLVTRENGHRIGHKLIHYMADRKKHRDRWVEALIHTKVPLRLINGPEDPVSGRHAAERFQELIPNPDVVFLDKIGHYPQTEDPEGVWKAYIEFRTQLNILN